MEDIQVFRQITLEEWLSWKEDIREKLRETAGNFVYIGFRLKQIRDSGMFDGAADIFEFAQKEYGLSKSTTSRFIAINEKFSEDGNSLELRQEFKAIGSSKLAEMLTLTDAECQLITEKTTVKEIRELKSFSRQQVPENAAERSAPEGNGNGGQKIQEGSRGGEPLTPLQKCLADFFKDKKEALNEVIPAVCEARYKDAAEVMNPSGHCTHKKGLCFLFMEDYSTGVKAKLLTEPTPRVMTWPELLTELQSIYADIITSGVKDIHSAYYGAGEMSGNGSGSETSKAEESPKKLNAEAPVATSQQEEKTAEDETADGYEEKETADDSAVVTDGESQVKDQKATHERSGEMRTLPKAAKMVVRKKPAAAAVEEMPEEPLPGQMELGDYPNIIPNAHYEEIPVQEPDPAASVTEKSAEEPETEQDLEATVGKAEEAETNTEEPEAVLKSQDTHESISRGESGLEEGELIWMDVEDHLSYLRQWATIWNYENVPKDILLHAYHNAIDMAAAIERLMDLRGVENV